MKFLLPLILLLSCLVGCQQKSEIDKCVEAQVRSLCFTYFPDLKSPEKGNMNAKGKSERDCGDFVIAASGGQIREQCLRARAGKE